MEHACIMTERSAPSVIICVPTFRRPAGLRKLLTHIERLNYPGKVSIVVVDNDSEARFVARFRRRA
jgi:glycosyltransferase involved in cell wall biosynthesis